MSRIFPLIINAYKIHEEFLNGANVAIAWIPSIQVSYLWSNSKLSPLQ